MLLQPVRFFLSSALCLLLLKGSLLLCFQVLLVSHFCNCLESASVAFIQTFFLHSTLRTVPAFCKDLLYDCIAAACDCFPVCSTLIEYSSFRTDSISILTGFPVLRQIFPAGKFFVMFLAVHRKFLYQFNSFSYVVQIIVISTVSCISYRLFWICSCISVPSVHERDPCNCI